jgi:hypothetical protein
MNSKIRFLLNDILIDTSVASAIIIIKKVSRITSLLWAPAPKIYYNRHVADIFDFSCSPLELFNLLKSRPYIFFNPQFFKLTRVVKEKSILEIGDELLIKLNSESGVYINLKVLNVSRTSFSLITLDENDNPGSLHFKIEQNDSGFQFSIESFLVLSKGHTPRASSVSKLEKSNIWVHCCEEFAKKCNSKGLIFRPIIVKNEKLNPRTNKWEPITNIQ